MFGLSGKTTRLFSVLDDFEELVEAPYFESVVKFMPSSFNIVGSKSQDMLEADRRYTYITPKSFLELIKYFELLIGRKDGDIEKYDELELEGHEHILTIIKNSLMRKEIKLKFKEQNQLNERKINDYFWTCSICKRDYSLDSKSALCETCFFEVCEECANKKENSEWLLHIVV